MALNKEEIRAISVLSVDTASWPWLMYEVNGRLYCGTGKYTGELEIWRLKGSDSWVKEHSLSISSSVPSHCGCLVDGAGALGIIDKEKRFILHLQRQRQEILPSLIMPFELAFFLFDLESKQAIQPLQLEDEDVVFCSEMISFFPTRYCNYPIAHVDGLVSWV